MVNHRSKQFGENTKDEDVLRIAGALASLMSQPGWEVWERYVYDAREETREELETCKPEDIAKVQGAANALTGILKAPKHILDHAKDIQDKIAQEGKLMDTVRASYPDADPV